MVVCRLRQSGDFPERVDEWPDIYPDYIGVTIPATIAPMNFNCIGGAYERVDVTVTGGKSERCT